MSTTARKPAGGTSQNPIGSVMNRGLTVIMPRPALFTSRSIPPSRDQASATARATSASSRASAGIPT
ncbi:MAG: hypothetical protein WAK82_06330, partial [Streptosporangiaceae bacterium]